MIMLTKGTEHQQTNAHDQKSERSYARAGRLQIKLTRAAMSVINDQTFIARTVRSLPAS